MILGLKIALGITLLLVFAIILNFAFSLINAPDDMSVIVGFLIVVAASVGFGRIANGLIGRLIKQFKTMAANRAVKKEKSDE